ncbi:hypothetical protein QO230_00625 [Vibrio vulnificus]|uniref:hypothetical protein n=1 Tax=Vibrio vulnificus TaxID=672 RepID=UPI0024E02893|nr:hypothetical protein [Vibrio vulnificus]MDK2606119.1 hypothetical protein [Vibrio vulnificus]MDK2609863.1 hypothetical protein [Vibrio vulnificus]MDK2627361.1 hypothetical protein [Vibrio vulnificus]MDK2702806.1 hypothetical protein [Vibrio vulnificus]
MTKRKPKNPTPEHFIGYIEINCLSHLGMLNCIYDQDSRTYCFGDGTRVVIQATNNRKTNTLAAAEITLCTRSSDRHKYEEELSTLVHCGLAAQFPCFVCDLKVIIEDAHLIGV